jgi:hypothetical protein
MERFGAGACPDTHVPPLPPIAGAVPLPGGIAREVSATFRRGCAS